MSQRLSEEESQLFRIISQPSYTVALVALKARGRCRLDELHQDLGKPLLDADMLSTLESYGIITHARGLVALTPSGEDLVSALIDALTSGSQNAPAPPPHQARRRQYSRSSVQSRLDDHALAAFLNHLSETLNVDCTGEIAGGYSGARTVSVNVLPKAARGLQGHLILKICPAASADDEIAQHRSAAEDPILNGYVPRIVEVIQWQGLAGIFFAVAGGSLLDRSTLQAGLDDEDYYPFEQVRDVATRVIAWNLSLESPPKLISVRRACELMQRGFGCGGLAHLMEECRKFLSVPHASHVISPFSKKIQANPLPFLLGLNEVEPQTDPRIFEGKVHGDLHAGNIIIPRPGKRGKFNLIDFASARTGNALFDLAYLELSLLLGSFGGFASEATQRSWWRLEDDYLSCDLAPQLKLFPYRSGGVIPSPIRQALGNWARTHGFQDAYWISFLAASVEAGLAFVRIFDESPRLQCIAFLAAVSRFDRLLAECQAQTSASPEDGKATYASIRWPH